MSRIIFLPLITLVFTGCLFDISGSESDEKSSNPINEDPFLTGEIVESWLKDSSRIMVFGDYKSKAMGIDEQEEYIIVGGDPEVFRQREDNSLEAYEFESLEEGQQIKAWLAHNVIMHSYPPQAGVKRIVVIEE